MNSTVGRGHTLADLLRGYSGTKVARHVGVNKKRVYRWMAGESFPEVRDLPKLAEILCTTVSELTTVIAGSAAHSGEVSRAS